jgi:hypothetical protein
MLLVNKLNNDVLELLSLQVSQSGSCSPAATHPYPFRTGTTSTYRGGQSDSLRPWKDTCTEDSPGLVLKDLVFRGILSRIGTVSHTDPQTYAAPLVEELRDINIYAGQFHHDTNPGLCDTLPVNTSELLTYSQRALTLVYRGAV